jgi:hypothetical protein
MSGRGTNNKAAAKAAVSDASSVDFSFCCCCCQRTRYLHRQRSVMQLGASLMTSSQLVMMGSHQSCGAAKMHRHRAEERGAQSRRRKGTEDRLPERAGCMCSVRMQQSQNSTDYGSCCC